MKRRPVSLSLNGRLRTYKIAFRCSRKMASWKSTVQANVRYTHYDPAVVSALREPAACRSTGKWETEIEQYIKQHAESTK